MKTSAIAVAVLLLANASSAQQPQGVLCIAPLPSDWSTSAPNLACPSGNLSLQIDTRKREGWPKKDSVKIAPLDATNPHRIVISCDGRPQQSFSFRFAELKTNDLCLFINDLYKTAQLWETPKAPWCRCK